MQYSSIKPSIDKFDIIYIEGPGDVVGSFRSWNNQEDVKTETSRTFSGQFFDFCKENHLKAYVISYHEEAKQALNSQFRVENIPKKNLGGGILYHLSQILYGLKLVFIGIKYRPKYFSVTTGVTYWFVLAPLKLFGINIVPQLHNSLWPRGHRSTKLSRRILLAFDAWFFRKIAKVSLCVSPEIQRQIEIITNACHGALYQFLPQFNRSDFDYPPKPALNSLRPFNVVFAGRVERSKGVFDLLDMAEQLRDEGVTFEICGTGTALQELKVTCRNRQLEDIVTIHGKLQRSELLVVYARAHVVIVPTRTDFDEGFAMVAAESVLMNRPVICSSVVPAVEVLIGAAIEVEAENLEGFVFNIRQLMSDPLYYNALCLNCWPLREQFLDGKEGLASILQKSLLKT